MKKLTIALLVLVTLFSFVSCKDEPEPPKEYTVTFDAQGHGEAPSSQSVEQGGKVTLPDAPKAIGYTFRGWYKDAECKNIWEFTADTVSSDITLYALWTRNYYSVAFDMDGVVTAPEALSLEHGSKVTKPSDPADVGEYTFVGWYKDEERKTKWDFEEDTVESNVTIYAKWVLEHDFDEEVCTVCGARQLGDNVGYKIEDGVFTLSGSGSCKNYNQGADVEWAGSRPIITSVVIGNGVTNIGNYYFYGCENLTSVSLGIDLESIGTYAFYKTTKLENISFPDSVTTIGTYAFYKSGLMGEVVLPKNLKTISAYLFYQAENIDSVVIPEGITSIGSYAFSRSKITSFYIPSTVTVFASMGELYDLETITLGEGNTKYTLIDGVLFLKSDETTLVYCPPKKTSYTIPESVIKLSSSSFFAWQGSELVVPEGVKTIDFAAFRYSAIESIVLPSTLTSLGQWAFMDAKELTTVEFKAVNPPKLSSGANEGSTFSRANKLTVIYVPDESVEAYKEAFIAADNENMANQVSKIKGISEKP